MYAVRQPSRIQVRVRAAALAKTAVATLDQVWPRRLQVLRPATRRTTGTVGVLCTAPDRALEPFLSVAGLRDSLCHVLFAGSERSCCVQ